MSEPRNDSSEMNQNKQNSVEISEHKLNLLLKTLEDNRLEQDIFFKGVIDFIKWTTTLSLASIIWVATNYNSLETAKTYLQISIILLILSTSISIIIVYSIVIFWAKNWEIQSLLFKTFLSAFKIDKDIKNIKEDKMSSWISSHLPNNPNQFNFAILLHLVLLLTGLIFYLYSRPLITR